jgi:hypothetical protein
MCEHCDTEARLSIRGRPNEDSERVGWRRQAALGEHSRLSKLRTRYQSRGIGLRSAISSFSEEPCRS